MKFNFVYITTNLVNGKRYVGDHSTNDLKKDKYLGSGRPAFKNAIKKYGKENFKREILEFFDTKQEAFDAQEKYIKLYKSHVSQCGYNISWKGGHDVKNSGPWVGKHLSPAHRKKISEGLKGKNVWSKGSKHSEETKRKISDSEKGKKISVETMRKMSEASKGKPKSNEHKEKCRVANLGKKAPRKICEYCGKDVAVNVYARFHGAKCKFKNI
jgi:group I intron endonuclease